MPTKTYDLLLTINDTES